MLCARLILTAEIADLVVMGIKLLILSCKGENLQEIKEIVGDNMCLHEEVLEVNMAL